LETFLKTFLEPFSYFIYAVVFFLKLLNDSSYEEKVLFIYYLCATILSLVASWLVVYAPETVLNNWLYNVLYFITICVLSLYFYRVLDTTIKKNIVMFLCIGNVVLFIIYNVLLGRFFSDYNQHVYSINFLSIVIYALFYFDQLLRNVSEINILHRFSFWLISGYLLYFLGCFSIILFYTTIPVLQRGYMWSLQNIILFVSSLIILTGYLRMHYHKKIH
jgi:hypothetical protein